MTDTIKSNEKLDSAFYSEVVELLQLTRRRVIHDLNLAMVQCYYHIGMMIVEKEQHGERRAEYGKQLIKGLSEKLTKEVGKGFSQRNIEQMRQFYRVYSKTQILSADSKIPETQTAFAELDQMLESCPVFSLSWSHYLKLMRIEDVKERKFYEIESERNNWSVRELQRQYDTALYTRLSLSRNKEKITELSEKLLILERPKDAIKDPYILEFIGLPENDEYSETDLEQEIIKKQERFLLELGTGFTFVARQKRISFDDKHFRIDLVFYNRILNCFVLIDLKIGELKYQDIGQMQMYVNDYDREIKLDSEKKTIGIILCQNKSEAVVEYNLPEDNEHIFASKYSTVLLSKDELKSLIHEH
jgi:predicted nuclease of restriction endonuclease-like (RecB) superfamily